MKKKKIYIGYAPKGTTVDNVLRWDKWKGGRGSVGINHNVNLPKPKEKKTNYMGYRQEDLEYPPVKIKITVELADASDKIPICDRDDIGLNGSSNDGIDYCIELRAVA